jgi:glycosyltransferase involved in cell wall biosynthesis
MISVLVLTHNEEHDLPKALGSVAWCDDVHVFDSFSSDNTAAIAKSHGASFTQREFDNYAAQRNAALDTLPFKHSWIFILDADEVVPPALAAELQSVTENAPSKTSAFRVRRRDYLFDTWLQHAQMSPWYIRLVRHGKARYWREVNEVLRVDGDVASLANPLDHFPFSKGIGHWVRKHNRYSTLEAQIIASHNTQQKPSLRKALTAPDFHERRLHQKAIFYRLPGRPLIKFLYLYLLRGGFLDGYAGLTYARLQAMYEYLIVVKTCEIEQRKSSSS